MATFTSELIYNYCERFISFGGEKKETGLLGRLLQKTFYIQVFAYAKM